MMEWKIMLSVEAQKVDEKVRVYDKGLSASDPRWSRMVYIVHEEGTVLLFQNAFLVVFDKEWVVAFTEHHGYHLYHAKDLDFHQQYAPIEHIDQYNETSIT